MVTYKTLIKQARKKFSNITTIEYIMQSLTNKKRHEFYLDNSVVPDQIIREVNELISLVKPDMPIQYLVHKAYFLSYELYVDRRVMIPRFETEELVMKTVSLLKAQNITPNTILDIGTGSGAIAIALAYLYPQAKIIATDISKDALAVAEINIKKYMLEPRISLVQTDAVDRNSWFALRKQIKTENGQRITDDGFDLIISNPPYIPADEIKTLAPTVRNYEPRIALNGGKNGFKIIEKIVRQAPNCLSQNGRLALEIDPRQVGLIKNLTHTARFEKDNQDFIRYAFIKYVA